MIGGTLSPPQDNSDYCNRILDTMNDTIYTLIAIVLLVLLFGLAGAVDCPL